MCMRWVNNAQLRISWIDVLARHMLVLNVEPQNVTSGFVVVTADAVGGRCLQCYWRWQTGTYLGCCSLLLSRPHDLRCPKKYIQHNIIGSFRSSSTSTTGQKRMSEFIKYIHLSRWLENILIIDVYDIGVACGSLCENTGKPLWAR